jgi:hypothetical protein
MFTFIIVIASVVYASLLEYLLHRYIMHHPVGPFRYPYEAHALTHHRLFKADKTYFLIHEKDKKTIPMAWWNGPVLVAISALPPLIVSLIMWNWWILIFSTITVAAYYGVYEYIHWCMHLPLPRRRVVESFPLVGWIFYRLNGHHLLHHRYMSRSNFNVVLPLWDLLTGTLLLRSKIRFDQARGHSVPDVQPK